MSRTPRPIAARHIAAADLADIRPFDEVLEIGPGPGVATTLFCAALAGGHVTAVDRSEKMLIQNGRRNARFIADGTLTLIPGRFEQAAFDRPFDKICAINVDFTRHPDRGWVQKLFDSLKPGGIALMVLEPPGHQPAYADAAAHLTAEALMAGGFETRRRSRPGVVAIQGRKPVA